MFCASTVAAQTPVVASTRDAAPSMGSSGAVKLPTTRPGSYIAGTRPLVSPPPVGLPELVLPPSLSSSSPPLVRSSSSAPTTLPASAKKTTRNVDRGASTDAVAGFNDGHDTLEPLPAAKETRRADGETSGDATPPARRKPSNVFLSRDALQKSRDKCQVQLKSGDQLKFATQGGEKEIRLSITGGRSCVKAISASDEWLAVSALGSNDEVTVSVSENEEATSREGVIVIANTGSSVHIKVRQEANTSGFRRIEL